MTPESLKRIKQFLIQEMIANNVEAAAWHELFIMAAMNQDLETMQAIIDAPITTLDAEDRETMQATFKLISSVAGLVDRIAADSENMTDEQVRDEIERTLRSVQADLGDRVQVRTASSIEQEAAEATAALLKSHMLH